VSDEIGDELTEGEPVLALPPGPLCARCFHCPCPCCPLPFCDLLQPGCCENECEVSREDFQQWQADCASVPKPPASSDDDEGPWLVVTVGPWLPVSVRFDRGIR
jgi:hypothetical protein